MGFGGDGGGSGGFDCLIQVWRIRKEGGVGCW